MLAVQPLEVLQHDFRGVAQRRLPQDGLGVIEDGRLDQRCKGLRSPDPVFQGIAPRRRLELAGGLVVDQRASIHHVRQNPTDFARVPGSTPGGAEAISVERLGDLLQVIALINELQEDSADRTHLLLGSKREGHTLVLDGLLLQVFQHVQRLAGFIQEQPVVAVGRVAADPVTLLGDLDAAVGNLDAEFLAELRHPEALELQVYGKQRIVRAGHAQSGIDHQLAVLLALGTVAGGQVEILEAAPPADVQA